MPAATVLTYELYLSLVEGTTSNMLSVSPEVARQILDAHNPDNTRKLSTGRVKTYKEYIRDGAWDPRISSIHVGADGNIDNGQHRLRAIAESEQPVEVRFEFGMGAEALDYYDLSKASRTAADHMARLGIHVRAASTILSLYVNYHEDLTSTKARPTTELSKLLKKNPDFKKYIEQADEIVKDHTGLIGPQSRYVAAVTILLSLGHQGNRLNEFIKQMVPGPHMGTVPFYASESLKEVSYGSTGNVQALHFILHAFNKWARHEEIGRKFNSAIRVPKVKLLKPLPLYEPE